MPLAGSAAVSKIPTHFKTFKALLFCYVRLDPAKVNITVRADDATWFHLAGVNIGNATDEYPKGDTIQVVEPWVPPDPWAELSTATVNAILDEIDRGLPNGQRFTNAPASSDERAAWKLVKQHCPDKTEGGCRKIIHEWLDNELLFARQYDDPVQRKPRSGLWVDNNRRPTGDDWSAGEEPDDEDEPL